MIFITGGARSGKSTFAEKLAIDEAHVSGRRLHYIAAGVPSDEEMKNRIMKHQKQRMASQQVWLTWEQPTHLEHLASVFTQDDIVLLDCLTTLLNNELFLDSSDGSTFSRILSGIETIQSQSGQFIVVSNEVLYEPLSEHELVMKYARILGNLHQEMVKKADLAYLVEAGIPIVMKGEQR